MGTKGPVKDLYLKTSNEQTRLMVYLETFTVDNRRTRFVVFLLGDPHLLEGGERGEDGSSDPDRVLALRGSNDFDLHRTKMVY